MRPLTIIPPRFAAPARLAVVIAMAIGAHLAGATPSVIVDSAGFEPPKFSATFSSVTTSYVGQLAGQAPPPAPLPVGTWFQAVASTNSRATIETTVVPPSGGTQAVRVDHAANSDQWWAVPVSGFPTQRFVCVDWDMRVEHTSLPVGSFGPFFGVTTFDDSGSDLGQMAAWGVDAATGDILYQAADTGFFVESGLLATFGQWNHYTIVMDYTNHQNLAYLNGSLITTSGFVDQQNIPGGLDHFTDADITTVAASDDPTSLAATGTAYFDNFKVVESATNPCASLAPISSISRTSGAVVIQLPVTAGQSIGMQYSQNLAAGSWTDIGTVQVQGNIGTFTDNDVSRLQRRSGWYRALAK